MFLDKVSLEVRAGKGGNGVVAWRREKYIPKGGPYGGNGGKGGDVLFRTSSNIFSFEAYRNIRILKAENGGQGGSNNKQGRRGRSLVIKIPPGTLLKDKITNEILYDFTGIDEEFLLCRGGRGGLGNTFFKSSINRAPNFCTPGAEGETRLVELELKLIADVGLVGLPNAGKTTLLNALIAVDAKVGAYPFTTLRPFLGFVSRKYQDTPPLIVADIPGIIRDAHQNKGLGFDFLRHIERTQFLIFVVDVSKFECNDPIKDLETLFLEISCYNEELINKPHIVLLNKVDHLLEGDTESSILETFQKKFPKKHFFIISGLTGKGIASLKEFLLKEVSKSNY